jgi:hypothetical protein
MSSTAKFQKGAYQWQALSEQFANYGVGISSKKGWSCLSQSKPQGMWHSILFSVAVMVTFNL